MSESQQPCRELDERKGGRVAEGGRGEGYSNMDTICRECVQMEEVGGGGWRGHRTAHKTWRWGGVKEQKRVMLTLESRL